MSSSISCVFNKELNYFLICMKTKMIFSLNIKKYSTYGRKMGTSIRCEDERNFPYNYHNRSSSTSFLNEIIENQM